VKRLQRDSNPVLGSGVRTESKVVKGDGGGLDGVVNYDHDRRLCLLHVDFVIAEHGRSRIQMLHNLARLGIQTDRPKCEALCDRNMTKHE